jgi:hypothetical protein
MNQNSDALNITDSTSPESLSLGTPQWSQNPVPQSGSTLLTVPILDHGPGIAQAEYVGSVDPGEGRGFPMAIEEDTLSATFEITVPKGPYPIRVRAKDITNTWTDLEPTTLTVI